MLTAVLSLLLAFNLVAILSDRNHSPLRDLRFWMLLISLVLVLVLTVRSEDLN